MLVHNIVLPLYPLLMMILRLAVAFLLVATVGCATNEEHEEPQEPEPPVEIDAAEGKDPPEDEEPSIADVITESLSKEIVVTPEEEARIEQAERDVYNLVHGAATEIDSFFGTSETDSEARVSRGRVSLASQYDDRNGYKTRLRFKARIKLPLFEERTRLLIGRGDADDIVDGSSNENIDKLPGRFQDIDQDDWLFGIGYSRDKRLKRGWSFDIGAKISDPIEPFVRAKYKWNRGLSEAWHLQIRPMIYWQDGRGNGASVQAFLDYSPIDNWLFRSYTIAQSDDRFQGIRWTSKLFTYHSLSRKSAFSYGLYAVGETKHDVRLQDYGLEIRHRRQVSSRYFYVEFLTYFSWPREFLEEVREFTPGIGIEFELQFGDWPGRSKKKKAD